MTGFIRKCKQATTAAREYQMAIDARNRALEAEERAHLEESRQRAHALDTQRRIDRHNRIVAHAGHTYRS